MIVDSLSQFHLGPAKIVIGGEEIWVRWYRAAPGAKPLPFPTFMGSAVWITDYDDDEPPLGMQGPTPPGRGKVPSRYQHMPGVMAGTPPGQHWHGNPDWFLNGLPADQLSDGPCVEWCGRPLMTEDGCTCSSGTDDIIGGQSFVLIADESPAGDDDMTQGAIVPYNFIIDKVTPALISTSQNDYLLGTGGAFRLSASAAVDITGFAGGLANRLVLLENVGVFTISLPHQNVGSLAANRIIAIDGVACRLYPNYSTWMQYDVVSARWRELNDVPFISQKGDLLAHSATGPMRLGSGLDGTVLVSDSTATAGIAWQAAPPSAFVGCRVSWSGLEDPISSGTNETLTWVTSDPEDYDVGGWYSAGSPDRVTVPADGYYLITASVTWLEPPASVARRGLVVWHGANVGSALVWECYDERLPVSGFQTPLNARGIYPLHAGDIVFVVVRQDSGVSLSLSAASNSNPENVLTVTRLGPL
jgi:hypothetical protein